MARLMSSGGWDAPETELPIPAGGLTRLKIRDILQIPADKPSEAYRLHDGGTLFARKPSPDLVGFFVPNMRASALCGHLIYGEAIHCDPGDEIIWNHLANPVRKYS